MASKKENLFLPLILGTAREGRRSEKAADFMLGQTQEAGIDTELIDVRDNLFVFTENAAKKDMKEELSKKFKKADGFIIVSPEYNHGYPGELKMFLDEFYPEFNRKPVGVCGVSNGNWGGARMAEQLKLACLAFQMVPINTSVYFRNMTDFDNSDKIEGERLETYKKVVKSFLDELLWFAKTLKEGREQENKN